MCHTTKNCQSSKYTQSSSSSSSSNSSSSSISSSSSNSQHICINSSRIYSYTLILALAALLLPLTHARHLHDQLSLGLSYDDASSSSSSSSSGSASSSSSSSSGGSLPSWHADPFHGLVESFGGASYDSSNSNSVEADAESYSSYEEIAQAAVNAAMHELRRQRIRHRRSHAARFFAKSEAETAPEWENPCGGVYQPDQSQPLEADTPAKANKRKYQHLIALRNNTRVEYVNIRKEANLDYGDIEAWQREYKFLPNMTRPTNVVKLKTWYRHMQTFVGSFAYLGRAHYKYNKEHQLPLGRRTEELRMLLVSARSVLCEIETTINASFPNSNGAKLSQVSRAVMQERLKFYTPADGSKEADKRDLKFTKQLYYQYLDNMWKSLRLALIKHRRSSAERRQHAAVGSSRSNSRQAFSLESFESSGSAPVAAGPGAVAGAGSNNDSGCSNSAEC